MLLLLIWGCNEASSHDVVAKSASSLVKAKPVLSREEMDEYFRKTAAFFEMNLVDRGFSGAILVAKDGQIVYEKYSGYADIRTREPLTDTTPLHIASAGKTLTGMAIMQLHERGILSIKDSITRFFPGLPYPGITVEMLLSHRSGLPNYLNYLSELKKRDTCYSNTDVLNSLYKLKPDRTSRAGTRFHYSNTNYVLLAMIVEKASGLPFDQYMQLNIFNPLGMTHTYVLTSGNPQQAAPSFEWNGRYWSPDEFDCTYGDKNIYTTARDLLKWDQAMYSDSFFSKDTREAVVQPLSNERPSIHNYGLAWRMLNLKNGKKVIYHNGRWHGTNAAFARLTDEKATIIVIGNKFNRNIYTAAKR